LFNNSASIFSPPKSSQPVRILNKIAPIENMSAFKP